MPPQPEHAVDLLSLPVVALLPCLDSELSLLDEAVDRSARP